MNNKIKQIVILALPLFSVVALAKENVVNPGASTVVNTRVASGCNPSNSKTDLDVNNVRATIMGGGDMWWDLDDAQYEIPKGGNKNSLFTFIFILNCHGKREPLMLPSKTERSFIPEAAS